MAVLYIGGVAMPDPKFKGMTVRLQDIDSAKTTRTANGTMIRDRVVGGANAKRKLVLEWPPLTPAQAQTLLQAVGGVFFSVTYPDPYTGGDRTAQFYVGDREAPIYNIDANGNPVWDGIKFDLIEK